MRHLGKSELALSLFTASAHPTESCGSNGLPLTPNSIAICGRFQFLKVLKNPHLCQYISLERGKHERIKIVSQFYKDSLAKRQLEDCYESTPNPVRIAYQILYGLSYINSVGIVHRCLSPDNILFDEQNDVKLAHYGLYFITYSGSCVNFPIGYPVYTAPECLLQGPVVHGPNDQPMFESTPKADVWSLGIILAEIVLGTRFFINLELTTIFRKLLSMAACGNGTDVFRCLAEEHGRSKQYELLHTDLRDLISDCLLCDPELRPMPDELLHRELFLELANQLPPSEAVYQLETFPTMELRSASLTIPAYEDVDIDDPLGERYLDEVFYLWQLAGGDLDAECSKSIFTKCQPPIVNIPKVISLEGEWFGQQQDRAVLFDETFVILSLDGLKQRLSRIPQEYFYPLVEEGSPISPLPDSVIELEKLPLAIREKDIEYQFHRIVLFERLLLAYPYKQGRIYAEAKSDIPPLYRAKCWASLLNITGDTIGVYERIDKDTPTATDRQIEVDIPRCHQYNELLSSPTGHDKFKRILKAWVVSHPKYVYWQGLDSLCAPFLFLNFNDEPLAFACFSAFISKYLHNFFLKDNSSIIQEYLIVFAHLIAFHDPELGNHLNRIGFIPELYAIPWFLTMFTHVFPLHKIFHLWDTMLLGNPSFPLCVGVAILHSLRNNLLNAGFNECILLFSDMPDVNIERCVKDAVRMFCCTPKSAMHRHHQKPIRTKKENDFYWTDEEMLNDTTEPISLETLKSELCPNIHADELVELMVSAAGFKYRRPGGNGGDHKSKPKLVIIDVRPADQFNRRAVQGSVNIPYLQAFTPDGDIVACQTKSVVEKSSGKALLIVIGNSDGHPTEFANTLVRLGYAKVCVVQGGIKTLKSKDVLVVPNA